MDTWTANENCVVTQGNIVLGKIGNDIYKKINYGKVIAVGIYNKVLNKTYIELFSDDPQYLLCEIEGESIYPPTTYPSIRYKGIKWYYYRWGNTLAQKGNIPITDGVITQKITIINQNEYQWGIYESYVLEVVNAKAYDNRVISLFDKYNSYEVDNRLFNSDIKSGELNTYTQYISLINSNRFDEASVIANNCNAFNYGAWFYNRMKNRLLNIRDYLNTIRYDKTYLTCYDGCTYEITPPAGDPVVTNGTKDLGQQCYVTGNGKWVGFFVDDVVSLNYEPYEEEYGWVVIPIDGCGTSFSYSDYSWDTTPITKTYNATNTITVNGKTYNYAIIHNSYGDSYSGVNVFGPYVSKSFSTVSEGIIRYEELYNSTTHWISDLDLENEDE